jgi:hypothetical protein
MPRPLIYMPLWAIFIAKNKGGNMYLCASLLFLINCDETNVSGNKLSAISEELKLISVVLVPQTKRFWKMFVYWTTS